MIDLQVLVFFSPRPEDHLRKTNAAGVAAAFVRELGESLVCAFPLVPPEWGAVPIKIGKKGNALGIHGSSMLQSGKGCQARRLILLVRNNIKGQAKPGLRHDMLISQPAHRFPHPLPSP